MSTSSLSATSPAVGKPWRVAVAGMVALATAMGIGRFAFTPLLPMMLHDGVVDLATASWLASANYIGYLVGALLCTFQPWIWGRLKGLPPVVPAMMVRAGLVATCALTLGMAWHWAALWPLLRFVSGVASAFVFVYTSGWCLARLARLGVPEMGGFIYVGPGAGITLSGLLASAMVAHGWAASSGWLLFAALALVLTVLVWPVFQRPAAEHLTAAAPLAPSTTTTTAATPTPLAAHDKGQMASLTVAYGLAGFGYIITATFLPVIARGVLGNSVWIDLFWPIFGLGVMLGAVLATRVPRDADMRLWLAYCYGMQGLGVLASVVLPSAFGFALGSLFLGLPFTAITFFAMQEVRRLRPLAVASSMGMLTAMYGLGQIVGPPLVALVIAHSSSQALGFTLSLSLAAGTLFVGVALYLWMLRRYPMAHTVARA
ncbi:YbfB/YjiJ family MFS transporter [Variovorax sp. HJSM1_2]|uniref:YbfB/YjiJ family MFS transporter n=1 Tax=Variovorax sp. HJSM1_2 TaxID=3366263 RepID=UPI003BCD4DA6